MNKGLRNKWICVNLPCVALLALSSQVHAHHSYAMFDRSAKATVQGTVAKIEWINPHVFVWLYVRDKNAPSNYDLYGFENGPISILTRYGWTPTTLAVGEEVAVDYFPLKDGRHGGYFIKATHADGTETIGDPHAPGVATESGTASRKPDR